MGQENGIFVCDTALPAYGFQCYAVPLLLFVSGKEREDQMELLWEKNCRDFHSHIGRNEEYEWKVWAKSVQKGDSLLASATNACKNTYYDTKIPEQLHTWGVNMAAFRLAKDGAHKKARMQGFPVIKYRGATSDLLSFMRKI